MNKAATTYVSNLKFLLPKQGNEGNEGNNGVPPRGGMGAKCGFAGPMGRTAGGVIRANRAPTRLMTARGRRITECRVAILAYTQLMSPMSLLGFLLVCCTYSWSRLLTSMATAPPSI